MKSISKESLIIFLSAIGLLVFYFFLLGKSYVPLLLTLANDTVQYLATAHHFLDHGTLTSPIIFTHILNTGSTRLYMPGYYLVLAGSYYFFGINYFSALLPSILSFIFSAVLVQMIGTKLYDKRVGFLAAVLFIISPFNLHTALLAMSEMTLVFISLAITYLYIMLPNKCRVFVLPFLLIIPFLFKQTTAILVIPLLALQWHHEKNKRFIFYSFFATLAILDLIYKWQVHDGLYSLNLNNMLFWNFDYGNAFLPNIHLSFTTTLIFILLRFYSNMWQLINGFIVTDIFFAVEVSFFMMIFLPAFILIIYGCKRKSSDVFPLFVGLTVFGLLILSLLIYVGVLPTLLRFIQFLFPLVTICFAQILLNNLSKPYRIVIISIIIFSCVGSALYSFVRMRNILHVYSGDVRTRMDLMESIHHDKQKLLLAPVGIALEYVNANYPLQWTFVPSNVETLQLLDTKFNVGTIVLPANSPLSMNEITFAGFHYKITKTYLNRQYFIFQK